MGRHHIRGVALGALVAARLAFAEVELEPRLSLSAEQRFDDELVAGPAPNQGLPVLTKVSPRAGLELKSSRGSAEAWYATDFSFQMGGRGRSVDHRGAFALHRQLTELSAVDAEVRMWRVTDPTSLPRLGMARVAAPIFYGSARAAVGTQLMRRFSLRAAYLYEGARIDAPGLLAGDVHSPAAEAWYRLTPRQDVGAEYRFQFFTYGPEDARSNGGFLAYRVRLTPLTTLTARGGPVWFAAGNGKDGWLPRASLELYRDGELLELGVSAGHDLVGASGFSSALWADYATLGLGYRLWRPFRLFGAASWFRNGLAPSVGWPVSGPLETTQGYAVGGGVEWFVSDRWTVQATVDRIAQVGVATAGVDLERNVAAVRLILTAF